MRSGADLWLPQPVNPRIWEKERNVKTKERWLARLQEYCNISTLHGFRNIAADGISWRERVSWICIVTICCGLTISTVVSVWQRYQYLPTLTTIESNHHPINRIPFPAVTVCNTNVVLKSSAETVMEKFITQGLDRKTAMYFFKTLPQAFKANRPFQLDNWNAVIRAMKDLNYTLETLMFELSQPCRRLLHRCSWKGEMYNCSDMFVHLATSEGFCCSFNWHGKVVEFDRDLLIRKKSGQWRQRGDFERKLFVSEAGTPTAGLSIVLDSEINNYFSSINSFLGVAVLIHDPERFPDIGTPRVFVQPQFETNVWVKTRVMESTDSVRSLNVDQRQCFFPEELKLKGGIAYSYESCVLDCKINAYAENCGCIPFFYPKYQNAVIPVCDLPNWFCLQRHKGIFSSHYFALYGRDEHDGPSCNCLPSCTDVAYEFQAYGNKIPTSDHASPEFEGFLGNRSSFSVYFQDNVCIKYRKVAQMSFETILASFGGILGLYLGGSVLSVIELIYYLTVKMWYNPKPAKTQVLPIYRKRIQFIAPQY